MMDFLNNLRHLTANRPQLSKQLSKLYVSCWHRIITIYLCFSSPSCCTLHYHPSTPSSLLDYSCYHCFYRRCRCFCRLKFEVWSFSLWFDDDWGEEATKETLIQVLLLVGWLVGFVAEEQRSFSFWVEIFNPFGWRPNAPTVY